ncbi:hypothetical protein KSP39_PZI001954 [Platanthera zijinensis]|uniref:Uncharacterized protein n=1 Tax=Platanthera zijinensis TaxID=2320716 RepID=A0AAP0BZA7_9ASPA
MKITQFLCFMPNFSEEETTIIQSKPELSISKRQCRRRRHSGSVFPIHGWSPEMNCSAPTSIVVFLIVFPKFFSAGIKGGVRGCGYVVGALLLGGELDSDGLPRADLRHRLDSLGALVSSTPYVGAWEAGAPWLGDACSRIAVSGAGAPAKSTAVEGGTGGSKPDFRTKGEEEPLQTELFASSEGAYRANAAGGRLVTRRPTTAPNGGRKSGTK